MSSLLSFLFTILLCFSMHGCKARHLGVGNKGFASLFHYHHHKGMVEFKLEMDSMGGKTMGSDKADHEAVVAASSTEERKDYSRSCVKEQKYRNGGGGGGFSGSVPINKPLVSSSLSWRVLSKNQDNNHDKNPGLFSDYSRPRTRPPSHN